MYKKSPFTLAAAGIILAIFIFSFARKSSAHEKTNINASDEASNPFTLIILPDTQRYALTDSWATIYYAQTNWIKENIEDRNIRFVLHEGDIVNTRYDQLQWDRANTAMSVLDGLVPYVLCIGNHDFSLRSRESPYFNGTFPLSRYENDPTFGGVFEPGRMDNTYHLFNAGGIDFLIVALEFGPRDETLAWASQIVQDHPAHKVVMVTHDYLYEDNTLHGSDPSHLYGPDYFDMDDANSGVETWQKFVKKHKNMLMTFSGHMHEEDGAGRLVGIGDHGNRVYQMLANFQHYEKGGNGWLRIVTIDTYQQTIDVETYSPYLDQYLTTEAMDFTYENVIEFNAADTTAPTTPGNLTAEVTGETQIELTWEPSQDSETGIKHYNIYRDSLFLTSSTNNSYLDIGLASNTLYNYQVSAVNNVLLESGLSNIVSATIFKDVSPPILLSAEAISDTLIQVNFNEPIEQTSAEASTNYTIMPNVIVLSASLELDLQSVLLAVSKLTEGSYTVTVNNIEDMAGNTISENSQANFTVADTTAPTTPGNLTAEVTGETQIELTWEPSEDHETGVKHYNIYRDSLFVASSTNNNYRDIGLTSNTLYNYQVSAVNNVLLESGLSNIASATIFEDVNQPILISAEAIGDTSVLINFNEPIAQTTAEAITNYTITPGVNVFMASMESDEQSVVLTVSDLVEGSYTVTVNNIEDIAGNRIDENSQANFTVIETISSVENDVIIIPEQYVLEQNYPNPFNPETIIRFQLPEASYVQLSIFNTLRQEIRTLADKQFKAGFHIIRWDGKNKSGNYVTSGIYLYHLRAGSFSQIKKMSLIR